MNLEIISGVKQEVLFHLLSRKMSGADMGRVTGKTLSCVYNSLYELEEKNLVQKISIKDGRVKLYELTEKGELIAKTLLIYNMELNNFDDLTDSILEGVKC